MKQLTSYVINMLEPEMDEPTSIFIIKCLKSP